MRLFVFCFFRWAFLLQYRVLLLPALQLKLLFLRFSAKWVNVKNLFFHDGYLNFASFHTINISEMYITFWNFIEFFGFALFYFKVCVCVYLRFQI